MHFAYAKAAVGASSKSRAGRSFPIAGPPRHQILQLQRMIGNQGVLRLMALHGVRVSHPNDGHELEADSMASRIMSMREDEIGGDAPPSTERIRGDRPQGQEDPSDRVDRFGSRVSPAIVSAPGPGIRAGLERLEGAGQPLAPSERSFFEPRFGASFGAVRFTPEARRITWRARLMPGPSRSIATSFSGRGSTGRRVTRAGAC